MFLSSPHHALWDPSIYPTNLKDKKQSQDDVLSNDVHDSEQMKEIAIRLRRTYI